MPAVPPQSASSPSSQPQLATGIGQPCTPQTIVSIATPSTMTVQTATIPKIITPSIMRTPSPSTFLENKSFLCVAVQFIKVKKKLLHYRNNCRHANGCRCNTCSANSNRVYIRCADFTHSSTATCTSANCAGALTLNLSELLSEEFSRFIKNQLSLVMT